MKIICWNLVINYNTIGCFIEEFLKKVHQFGMIDEKRSLKMRDRGKAIINNSKVEYVTLKMTLN